MRSSRAAAIMFTAILGASPLAMAQTPAAPPAAAPVAPAVPTPAPAAPAQATAAQPAGPVKIAVIDYNKILAQSKAAQSIAPQLKARHDSAEKQLSALERKLLDGKNKLDADKDKVKPDVFNKEVAAYREEYVADRKFADAQERELKQGEEGAFAQLRGAVFKIVRAMAEKNSYTLVLTSDNIVLALPNMDITDDVLAQLDKSVTNIPVTFGSGASVKKPASK